MGSCVSGQSTVSREEPLSVKPQDDAGLSSAATDDNRKIRRESKKTKNHDTTGVLTAFDTNEVGGEYGKLLALAESDFFKKLQNGEAPGTSGGMLQTACGIVKAVDAVLRPATEALDAVRREAEETSDEISLSEASSAVTTAITNHHPDPKFPSAIEAATGTLRWIAHGTATPSTPEVPHPSYASFYIPSVNHLFGCMRGTLVQPSAGSISKHQLETGLHHLEVMFRKIGVALEGPEWLQNLPFHVLNPITKSALLYIHCNETMKRFSLNPVRRHLVLDDAASFAKNNGHWVGVGDKAWDKFGASDCGGEFLKFFPAYEGPDGIIEYGEGHGPRKEFFDLAAEMLTSSWAPDADLSKKCSGEMVKGSRTVFITANDGTSLTIPSWAILVFSCSDLEQPFEAEVAKVDRNQNTFKITLTTESPTSSTTLTISLRLRASPLFQGDSTGYWFKEIDAIGQTPPKSLTLAQHHIIDTYGLAGWLLSQCLGNGTTMNLGLPVVFYKMLKSWPNWDPAGIDLSEASPELHSSLEAIKGLPGADFKSVLEVDGLPATTTKDEYIAQRVADHLKNDIYNQMTGFVHGFYRTGLKGVSVFSSCRAEELRLVLQGRGDDGVSDFNFHEEFHVLESQDFREGGHNKVFSEVLWKVIEGGMGGTGSRIAMRKRQFVKFLTGRQMLPAHAKQEPLNVVVPYTMFSAREFQSYLSRLPASHTCDNTLEVPNYMESLLFSPDSVWYKKAGVEVGTTVTFQMKAACWDVLSDDEKENVTKRLQELLIDRLSMAVFNSASYELDFIEQEHHVIAASSTIPPPPQEVPFHPVISRTSLTTPLQGAITAPRATSPPLPRYPMLDSLPAAPPSSVTDSVQKKLFVDITQGEGLEAKQSVVDCGDPWDTEDLDMLLKKLQD